MICLSLSLVTTQQVFMQDASLLAAVDLGSNSFRLEIGRLDQGRIQRGEYHKETVRQGNGLDAERNLSLQAMERGWACLARFSERLSDFKPSQVRAVATQTLREARNRDVFLSRAHQILGFPIEVISGYEEARLIYVGVSHLLAQSDERRLVLDIGGRSTELILGQGYQSNNAESFRVGSVAWSMRYFTEGQLTPSAFSKATIAAKAILDETATRFIATHWDTAYGSSGTVGAVADILHAGGFAVGVIERKGLDWLHQRLIDAKHVDYLKLTGLREDRRAVIAGGVSILLALFDLLDIDVLHAAEGALRHGLLFDLVECKDGKVDIRQETVDLLSNKFNIDKLQSMRVRSTVTHLLAQTKSSDEQISTQRLLGKALWAAQLHEIGIKVSHSDYHKHGAYILDNAEAAGFAQSELHRLSLLVLGQRGKLKKLGDVLNEVNFAAQLVALRLAVILCHARKDPSLKGIFLRTGNKDFSLEVPAAWAQTHPQSIYLLQEEATAWQKLGWKFSISSP